MDRRTFITAATCASVAPIAALASAELEELIRAHQNAELNAYGTDGDLDDLDRELEARKRLLAYRPRSVAEAGRQLSYLAEVPWEGVSAEPWELSTLAATYSGGSV